MTWISTTEVVWTAGRHDEKKLNQQRQHVQHWWVGGRAQHYEQKDAKRLIPGDRWSIVCHTSCPFMYLRRETQPNSERFCQSKEHKDDNPFSNDRSVAYLELCLPGKLVHSTNSDPLPDIRRGWIFRHKSHKPRFFSPWQFTTTHFIKISGVICLNEFMKKLLWEDIQENWQRDGKKILIRKITCDKNSKESSGMLLKSRKIMKMTKNNANTLFFRAKIHWQVSWIALLWMRWIPCFLAFFNPQIAPPIHAPESPLVLFFGPEPHCCISAPFNLQTIIETSANQ